ncbi:MAG: HAMP domain-containing histidine kinase [Bacteroidetes bacterium]|nr:HAMP domain-containing histidine kinase [Bacteroidota bacterium]MCB9226560.1 HAMP domain-containing histidine kinase [Chitinophagales bacterium]
MFKDKDNTKYLLFYLIIIYVFAFVFWWSYLLYTKTAQHYSDLVNLKSIQYEQNTNKEIKDYFLTEDFKNLDAHFKRQKTMIITEGSVFIIVLLFGIVKIYKSFQQEIKLALQQKNFLLSITHELKSPLASIKLMNETVKNRDLPKPKQNELLEASLQEVNRLSNLVENILLAAKIENNTLGFNKNKLNLSHIIKDITTTYKHREDVEINEDVQEEVFINGDMLSLNSIIINLIDNAIKYSNKPIVDITLQKNTKQKIELKIADNGKGISDSEKHKIFDKFYRVGNEDTRSTKGTGLGLYLVSQLVKFHNGKISVKDNKPTGSIFIVEFYD